MDTKSSVLGGPGIGACRSTVDRILRRLAWRPVTSAFSTAGARAGLVVTWPLCERIARPAGRRVLPTRLFSSDATGLLRPATACSRSPAHGSLGSAQHRRSGTCEVGRRLLVEPMLAQGVPVAKRRAVVPESLRCCGQPQGWLPNGLVEGIVMTWISQSATRSKDG